MRISPRVRCSHTSKGPGDNLKKQAVDRTIEIGKDVLIASAQSFGGQMAMYFFISCCVALAATVAMKKYKDEVLLQKQRISDAIKEKKVVAVDIYNSTLDIIKQSSSKARKSTTEVLNSGKTITEAGVSEVLGVDVDDLKEKSRDLKERLRSVHVDDLNKEKSRDLKERLGSVDVDDLKEKSRDL